MRDAQPNAPMKYWEIVADKLSEQPRVTDDVDEENMPDL
jgi:hypothetical protein